MNCVKVTAAALLLTLTCLSGTPGDGKLLRGYVSENQELTESKELSNQPMTGSVRADSLPASYEGTWRCLTIVTDSAVTAVPVGQKMVSDVQFLRKPDGRIIANWSQPGWTETQCSILTWSKTQGQVDRTNYYYGEKMQGAWAARSRDKFTQVGGDRILAESYVDQYIDGHYLGRYRTRSVLTRTSSPVDVAQAGSF
ncbi:MAG TPA: hypothetical protein V6D08_10905 [Candidatus Obscuribacterales bacterium]